MVADRALHYSDQDFCIISGHRSSSEQARLFAAGDSHLPAGRSLHENVATPEDINKGHATTVGQPLSLAIDTAPWYAEEPHIRWDREVDFVFLGAFICGVGRPLLAEHGFTLRSGSNWDRDTMILDDQTLRDPGHVEMVRIS
jgi:hypothetical protein